jgi:hypothetical protein
VPKFSESHLLPFQDMHILMIVCLSVREFILKRTNEDFQDQMYEGLQERVYGDFKNKYTRILIFSFQSNETCVLEYFAHNILYLFCRLELHDRNVCPAYLCWGLIRIDLSFLENLRSNWVVVTCLELLSLA